MKVDYVDHMGNDLTVVNSARISMNRDSQKLEPRDEKLINYLADHQHYTPFEHCMLTVIIECPLYIRSQIMRHRTASYNEVSRRYTEEEIEFYNPNVYRKQHKSSKQCSDGDLKDSENLQAQVLTQSIHQKCFDTYKQLLDLGVSREMARGVLPQNMMTKFYMTMNLRNWAHFLKLRLDNHAQLEVQEIAQDVKKILLDKFPVSGEKLLES